MKMFRGSRIKQPSNRHPYSAKILFVKIGKYMICKCRKRCRQKIFSKIINPWATPTINEEQLYQKLEQKALEWANKPFRCPKCRT